MKTHPQLQLLPSFCFRDEKIKKGFLPCSQSSVTRLTTLPIPLLIFFLYRLLYPPFYDESQPFTTHSPWLAPSVHPPPWVYHPCLFINTRYLHFFTFPLLSLLFLFHLFNGSRNTHLQQASFFCFNYQRRVKNDDKDRKEPKVNPRDTVFWSQF